MRPTRRGLLMAISIVALMNLISNLISAAAYAQEKAPDDMKAKQQALYLATVNPGPEHKRLEALAGTWDQEIKFWPAPGAKPLTIKSRSVNRMVLGGRFLVCEGKGGQGPMTMESMQILGFDRRYNRYTAVAYDSMGTYYITAAGGYDESKNAIVMSGEETYPTLGTEKYDMVSRTVSPDQYVVEIIFKDEVHTQGKGPFKAVEITNTRVK